MILNIKENKYTDSVIELFYEYKLMSIQIDLENIIHESLLNECGAPIKEYQILTEGILANAKAKFVKLIEAISKIIGRFIEAVNNLVKSDKSYLNKYKDIILNKQLKTSEYTMYPYWKAQQTMLNATVPAFNMSTIEGIKDKKDMESKLFNTYASRTNDKLSFEDVVENTFRGSKDQMEIPSNQINLKNMFNYCVDYSKNIDIIKKDLNNIEKAGNDAILKIKSADRQGVSTEETHYMEEYYYSIIENTIIYEEPLVHKKSKTDNELDTTAGRRKVNVQNVQGKNQELSDDDAKNVKDDKVKDEIKSIELYIEVCTNFLSAKMSIMEETYKAYMFIIRDHIKSYVGEKENKNSTSTNNSSSTSQNNNDSNTNNNNKQQDNKSEKEKENDKKLDDVQKDGLFSKFFNKFNKK